MYRKKVYNFLFASLIVIFSVFICFASIDISLTDAINDNDEEEIIVDETPPTEPNPEGLTAPDSSASAYERLDFAFKILFEGAGNSNYYSQYCTVLGQTQKIIKKNYSSKDFSLSEEWSHMDGIFSTFGQNQFSSMYINNLTENIKIKTITNSNNYNFDKKTYNQSACDEMKNYTFKQWREAGEIPFDKFFTTINKDTTTIIQYDKGKKVDYYTIKLDLDLTKLDKEYVDVFKKNSDSITLKYITITFTINKATGYFKSYNKVENFDASLLGHSANCTTYSKVTYTSMNKSQYDYIKPVVLKSFSEVI